MLLLLVVVEVAEKVLVLELVVVAVLADIKLDQPLAQQVQ
jgi:hypothetical protein